MFPTPWTVDILPHSAATFDDYGNPTESYGAPVSWPVYGWSPAGSREANGWQRQVTADLQVYGPPPPVAISPSDRIVVAGDAYDVEGKVEDYDHGPFGFAPGVVVNLRQVAG